MMNLEPAFNFVAGARRVLLRRGQSEICIDGNTYTGEGEVYLELVPRSAINLYGYFQGVPAHVAMSAAIGQKPILSFSFDCHQVEGFRVSSGGDATKQEYNVKWCPKSEPIMGVGDESTQITWLVFHFFNFVDLIGTRRSTEQSGDAIEHVDLLCSEWNVELKSLISTRENMKLLKEEGGYQLTHIGSFQKADATQFSGKDANEFLRALRFFLSFAKGGWCEPVCAAGFDASGIRVWESLSSPRETSLSFRSWFDPYTGDQIASLFPAFMKLCENEDWREALHEVIYWYLNANNSSRGIDAGIILTQAAIERLSYEYTVKVRKLVTVEGFKALWASDKFRLLFSSVGIPLDIPVETPELQRLARNNQMKWLDAPHALTEIRNSLVHPEHKRRGQLSSAYREAWNLGLWCLEMGILAICGYSGTYGNRLKQRFVGQIEDVPWKK